MAHGPDTDKALKRIQEWINNNNVRATLSFYKLNLTSLPPLPDTLQCLDTHYTRITRYEYLPRDLESFQCCDTPLTYLPPLPLNLKFINCGRTPLKKLPKLPSELCALYCFNTQIEEITELPAKLVGLSVSTTRITSLPELPLTLYWIKMSDTPIRVLPDLARVQSINFENCNELLLQKEPGESIYQYNERWAVIRNRNRCRSRVRLWKEEIIAAVWHPRNVERWLTVGGWPLIAMMAGDDGLA